MGLLVFFILLAVEIGFGVYVFRTNKWPSRKLAWTRIALFVAFVLLFAFSVFESGVRWFFVGLLLFVMAVNGAIALIRRQEKQPKKGKVVFKSLIVAMIALIAVLPAILFPQHKEAKTTGDFAIQTKTFTYTDESRVDPFSKDGASRFVNVEFWYPKASGDETFPLLVFSHGANGVKASNSSSYKELASHGYVVVSIDHPGHAFFTRSEDGTITTMDSTYSNEVKNLNTDGVYTNGDIYELVQKWMTLRAADMEFVIDTVVDKAAAGENGLYAHVDPERIGVFGHSMGGAASVWVARERDDVDAVVNIDSPFFSDLTYDKASDSYGVRDEDFTKPLLNIYSDDVWNQLGSSIYIANSLDNAHFKQAETVHIEGAKHLTMTDLAVVSPMLANTLQGGKASIDAADCLKQENELLVKFFDNQFK